MGVNDMYRSLTWCLMVGALGLTSGCATLFGPPPTKEEAVTQRALERREALAKKRYEDAYEFFTPSFKEAFSYEAYMRLRPPRVDYMPGAKVIDVKCASEDACDADVETGYANVRGVKSAPKGEIVRVVTERWVKVDGEWWLYQKQ